MPRHRHRDSPAGPFVDMGMPLLLGMGFEYIDPMAFDDPVSGKRFLYWGSGFQPIKVQELAEDRMSFAPDSEPVDLDLAQSREGRLPAAGRSRLGDRATTISIISSTRATIAAGRTPNMA